MERAIKVIMDMRSLSEKVKEHYGLPPDAICRSHEYDAVRGRITFTFQHQTFDLVKEPETISAPQSEPEKAETPVKPLSDAGAEGFETFGKKKKDG